MIDGREYVTVSEAARLVGNSHWAMRRAAARLPHREWPGATPRRVAMLIAREDVVQWALARRRGPRRPVTDELLARSREER